MSEDINWRWQMVRDFHRAIGQPAPDHLDLDQVDAKLRARLVLEEALEFVHALGCRVELPHANGDVWEIRFESIEVVPEGPPNWPEVIDAQADLAYVNEGTAVAGGYQLTRFFREVARSNMTKVGGPVDEHGKLQKPAWYESPRIAYLWDRLVRGAR